jgi:ABC-2 type transport system ATP-binding protein
MSIEVRQLTKVYGEQKAVNRISFTIKKGEIVGFLGPNGAGKSTTMKIITGYLQADEGIAEVCGLDVKQYPVEIKQKIGYLPESNPLYYDMYVNEYLQFIAGIHSLANRPASVNNVIELTGLQVERKKKIGQLSKGYKQRIGLAAALIHQPEVLILDEPTSGLDPNQIIEIRNVIRQQGQNKTILFSSHILQEVEAICDRVVIINQGKIVADDTLLHLENGKKDEFIVSVRFKEQVGPSFFDQLQGAGKVDPQPGTMPPPLTFYKIHTSQPEQVRRKLLEFSLQHNLNIVSLQTEGQSLEEVFRSLTAHP